LLYKPLYELVEIFEKLTFVGINVDALDISKPLSDIDIASNIAMTSYNSHVIGGVPVLHSDQIRACAKALKLAYIAANGETATADAKKIQALSRRIPCTDSLFRTLTTTQQRCYAAHQRSSFPLKKAARKLRRNKIRLLI
jgi:hypothetical protein